MFAQNISTKLRAGDDQRKSRAIGICKLIPDTEQRTEWLAMANNYGDLWPEGCTGPPRYIPPTQITIDLDTDETDTQSRAGCIFIQK